MGRRIEVELTSARDDGSWTWRVAGARQPKGELVGSLLYDGAQVGDVVKAEAEFHVDGIEIIEVLAPKKKRERTNLLELKTRPLRDDELVTTQRVPREGRRSNRRGDREGRRGGRRDDREGREGRNRPPRSSEPARPKPKRLRPKRTHRDALLTEVGEEHRPIVEQVMAEGMPGVRAAIDKQNAEAKEADKPAVDPAPILAIAEKNLQKARLAEWRDRADAALELAAELDLRDLRSVVVAGNDLARDPESREVADRLKAALDERVEADHAIWLADLDSAVSEGRVVRALRLSSRPVKAGAPLPPELASTLATQASEAMSSDVGQERWATVLDALAFSPVRGAVTPVGIPAEPKAELVDAVKRVSDRVPTIATLFGIDPAEVPRSARRRRSSRDRRGRQGSGPGGGHAGAKGGGRRRDKSDKPASAKAPVTDPAKAEAEASRQSPASAPAVDSPATERPAAQVASAERTPSEPAATANGTVQQDEAGQRSGTEPAASSSGSDAPTPQTESTGTAEPRVNAPDAEADTTSEPGTPDAETEPAGEPRVNAPDAEADTTSEPGTPDAEAEPAGERVEQV
jgi:hypothetical protein